LLQFLWVGPKGETKFYFRPYQNQQANISIKLGKNHPWVKGILNCSNKGPGPLQRGDNNKNAKIWRGH
jgi:hypothetical protein